MTSPAGAGSGGLRHAAVAYPTAGQMTESMLAFVKAGVEAGDAVLIASAGPVLQRLRLQLGGHGEHVMWTGMASPSTNPRRITAAMRAFADEHPSQPIRFVQEPAWHLLPQDHLCEAIRHESLVNLALNGSPAMVLCAYQGHLDGELAASAQRIHPMVLQDGEWQPSGEFDADAPVPGRCGQPLPVPPASAASLSYRADQAGVRQFVADRARLAGLAPDRVTDLVIAAGELAANTLAHTSGPGTLWVWAAGGEILCQVADSGYVRDPLAGSFLPDPAEPGGGRGLWVVHQLCDLVETRTGPAGTAVRLHMRLTPPDQARLRARARDAGAGSGHPAWR